MFYTTPRPMPKKELLSDIAKQETKYKNQSHTLSQFFDGNVLNAWDTERLTAAELLIIKDNIAPKSGSALILLELKNS